MLDRIPFATIGQTPRADLVPELVASLRRPVVLHCMGYMEAQRETVASASERPALLARRLVAAAIGQLL